MLAGVGPVRLVLFVVAADEGWKPQSEEHLAIVDVLGVDGGVDRADEARPRRRRRRSTGDGRRSASDVAGTASRARRSSRARRRPARASTSSWRRSTRWSAAAPAPSGRAAAAVRRPRVHDRGRRDRRDRARSPADARRRRRGRALARRRPREDPLAPDAQATDRGRASPVSRVAVNLVGRRARRGRARRRPRPARARGVRPTCSRRGSVRSAGWLASVTPRGAFTLPRRGGRASTRGSASTDGDASAEDGAFARIRLSRRSCWTSGTGSCCASPAGARPSRGGVVLDVAPPATAGHRSRRPARPRARRPPRDELPALLVVERGAVRADDVFRPHGLHRGRRRRDRGVARRRRPPRRRAGIHRRGARHVPRRRTHSRSAPL